MDKYTYSMKAEKIQKLVKKGDYEAAVKIADTVDWEEVHSVRLLTITAAAYENIRDYRSAIELLQLAYEESAVGKRILYKLTGLAIADKNVDQAQHYYEMYLQEASDDNGRYLLRYLLAELKKEPLDKRIAILETYRKYEFEEEWALRLAQMYDEAGMGEQCVKLCDEIILWFGVGEYVDEAMALKEKYAPLSARQQEHRDHRDEYAKRYQEVVDEYNEREAVFEEEDEKDEDEEEPLPEKPMEKWPAQIILVEADNLDDAVRGALEQLAQYYRMQNKPMGKLTRISAERFNRVGFESAREHTRGKDVLIDEAGAVSEDLLSDIVHSIKYDQSEQVFVLADKAEQLAYLDSRLNGFLEQDDFIPQIEMTEMRAEDVLSRMTETVEGELAGAVADAEELAGELPLQGDAASEASVPAAASMGQDVEQLSFDFDKEEESRLQDWAAAAGAIDLEENPVPGGEGVSSDREKAAGQEEQEREALFSFSDFLSDQSAALEATAVTAGVTGSAIISEAIPGKAEEIIPEKAEEIIPEKAEEIIPEKTEEILPEKMEEMISEKAREILPEKMEETVSEIAEEIVSEKPEETAPENPLSLTDELSKIQQIVTTVETADIPDFGDISALTEKPAPAEEVKVSTKELPVSEIREVLGQQKDKTVSQEKTTVVSDVRKTVAELEQKNLEGATKVVSKLGTATGAIGAIGMSEEDFVTYAKNYLNSIDCVLDEAGSLALQNAAEARKEKGILLTKEEAENMIEEAADMSERKGALFGKRYNKEGYLIIKGRYIQ